MGDVGDTFNALKKHRKAQKAKRLSEFSPDGWTKHTPYHFSKKENGYRIDFYPSTNRRIKTKLRSKQ